MRPHAPASPPDVSRETFEGLTFSPLTQEDIPLLTPVMKRAFDDDARLYFGRPAGGPDGYDDGSFLRKWGLESGAAAFRIDREGRPVGAMILFIRPQQAAGHLGSLFIDPDFMGRGLGAAAWRFAEHRFPQVGVWTTETPAVSYRNHRFYVNTCGFHVVAVTREPDRFEAQFQLRKIIPQP